MEFKRILKFNFVRNFPLTFRVYVTIILSLSLSLKKYAVTLCLCPNSEFDISEFIKCN